MKEYLEKLLQELQAEIRKAKRDSDAASWTGDKMYLYYDGLIRAKVSICDEIRSILLKIDRGILK